MAKTKPLTRTELKFIADMLDFAADEFESNPVNDYIMPATDDNKKFMVDLSIEMSNEYEVQDEVDRITDEKDEILAFDCVMMRYLSRRCKALSEK